MDIRRVYRPYKRSSTRRRWTPGRTATESSCSSSGRLDRRRKAPMSPGPDPPRTDERSRCCVQLAEHVDVTPFYATDGRCSLRTHAALAGPAGKRAPGRPFARACTAPACSTWAPDSGVLVEQATRLGWEAEGVEPSAWLADRARERGISVHTGTLPHPALTPPYDVVTLVDVIEHVTDPARAAGRGSQAPPPGGPAARGDPRREVGRSPGARPRWWHYRIAHVGYFSPSTLDTLLSGSGFVLEGWRRPAWYFSVDHVRTLAARLIPFLRWVPVPRAFARATVRLNLFDSMAALYRAPAR